jgi:hypothetical protein
MSRIRNRVATFMARAASLLIGLSGLLGTGALAATQSPTLPERIALESRVLSVRQALNATAPSASADALESPMKLAQWLNWPNWNNWANWRNWGNYPMR